MSSLVTGIAHVGIRVHHMDRARAFYDLLGFEFIVGPVGPEPVAILRHPCGIELNLILNGTEAREPNVLMDVPVKHAGYTHVALAIRSIEEALKLMEDNGHAISDHKFTPGARFSQFGIVAHHHQNGDIDSDEQLRFPGSLPPLQTLLDRFLRCDGVKRAIHELNAVMVVHVVHLFRFDKQIMAYFSDLYVLVCH